MTLLAPLGGFFCFLRYSLPTNRKPVRMNENGKRQYFRHRKRAGHENADAPGRGYALNVVLIAERQAQRKKYMLEEQKSR